MSHWTDELPPLDTHAHVAPDVTSRQINELGAAQIFAVTRSLEEAAAVMSRTANGNLTWGCGVHPADREALESFSVARLRTLLPSFSLVGEIGLDRRAGDKDRQRKVFAEILEVVHAEPVLLSIHSSGAIGDVLDALEAQPPKGPILHWFTGGADELTRAVELGCFFSVNTAMSDEALAHIPPDRLLPETDFPSTRSRGASLPGAVRPLEDRLARLWAEDPFLARKRLYRNLRTIATSSGAVERLPEKLADLLLVA